MAIANKTQWDALYTHQSFDYLSMAYQVLIDTGYPEVAVIVQQAREQLRAFAISRNVDHFLP